MKIIFQSHRHPEVIIKVDLSDVNLKAKLFAWFNFKHNDLFNDGETHYAILSYAHITKMFNRGYYEVRSGDCRVEMFYLNHH